MVLTFGSLFSGVGGADLGFERAGLSCKWQVEIDDFCNRVLTKHWPNVPKFRDVRECGANNLTPVDVIWGSPPCQPHSIAGKQRGAADDRNLWPEMCRIITELKPTWIAFENVPGIISTILPDVLSDLENINYEVGTIAFPAAGISAPHKRERVFVLAHTNNAGRGEQRGAIPISEKQFILECDSGGSIESRICGIPTRLSEGMDRFNGSRIENPWTGEWPGVPRTAYGIPNRVNRLRALGNAVVPQVAQWLGENIIAVETAYRNNEGDNTNGIPNWR